MRRRFATIQAIAAALAGCGSGAGDPAAGPRPAQWFTEITAQAGIDFVHESGGTGGFLMPEIMGPGCALFDCDNDGDLDIYMLNGNRLLPAAAVSAGPFITHLGLESNTFYRNTGAGNFIDATGASGLGVTSMGWTGFGTWAFDAELDGDLDLFVAGLCRGALQARPRPGAVARPRRGDRALPCGRRARSRPPRRRPTAGRAGRKAISQKE